MGANRTQPQRDFGSSKGAGLNLAELQEKTALLVHILRNVQKPVALSGLSADQARLVSALQQEPLFFHSVAVIRSGQEASPAYLMGLLFHLLSISEQEVAASDPEQLLNRHLTALDKKSQSLLLLVNDADQLQSEQRQQLVTLSERHPAIRLVFLLEAPVAEVWHDEQFCLFSLSKSTVGSPSRLDQSCLVAENRMFKVIGAVVVLLLVLMMALILILPKAEETFGHPLERMPAAEPLINEEIAEEHSPVNEIELAVVGKVVGPISADKPKNDEIKADEEPIQLPIIEVVEEKVKLDPSILVKPVQVEVLEEKKPAEPPLKPVKAVKEKLQVDAEAVAPLPRISRKRAASSEIHKEAWLLAQGKEKFSLQIMGGSEGGSIANYIKKQKEKGQFAYYRAVKKGKDWYPLLYGIYPSKEAAKQAVKELPREYQKLKPWARSLAAIQLEIRAAAGN